MRHILITPLLALVIFSHSSCYEVIAEVNDTKPNGKPRDFDMGAPDIKACLIDEWGMRCNN